MSREASCGPSPVRVHVALNGRTLCGLDTGAFCEDDTWVAPDWQEATAATCPPCRAAYSQLMDRAADNENEQETPMQDDTTRERFEGWAIVELMGHVTYYAYVSEAAICERLMLRLDVPATAQNPAFTKLVSPEALYGLTPSDEETIRAACHDIEQRPIQSYELDAVIAHGVAERSKAPF